MRLKKILILQPVGKGKYRLWAKGNVTPQQREYANFLELELADQRDDGVSDEVVLQVYDGAAQAHAAAKKLKPKVEVISARMLRIMAEDKADRAEP